MDRELIKLIEDNGLTLHGDIEFFAHLVAEREREACAAICDRLGDGEPLNDNANIAAAAIRARGGRRDFGPRSKTQLIAREGDA